MQKSGGYHTSAFLYCVKRNSTNVASVANMLCNAIITTLCNIIFALLGTFSVILLQKLILNSTNN